MDTDVTVDVKNWPKNQEGQALTHPAHVVAERCSESVGVEKIVLHVDHNQRSPSWIERRVLRLGCHVHPAVGHGIAVF